MSEQTPVPYSFGQKYKYMNAKGWESENVKKWMQETANEMVANWKKELQDYQTYKVVQFHQLDELLAVTIFGFDEKQAKRAFKLNNILRTFKPTERQCARQLRTKMEEEGAGVGNPIDFQIMHLRLLEEEHFNAEKPMEKTASIPVIRVRRPKDGSHLFIDTNRRIYQTWDDFLNNNKFPQGILAYPNNGFVCRKANEGEKDENGNQRLLTANGISFGEPPSCSDWERLKAGVDTVITYVSPIVGVTMFWNPAGWIGWGLTAVTSVITVYQMLRQGMNICDKWQHGEATWADITQLCTTIASLIIKHGTKYYLKEVVKQQRVLTTLERWVITGTLWGMGVSQLVNVLSMMYVLATKENLTCLDVLNFIVAARSLYSCVMGPKTAEALLKSIKSEMAAEKDRDYKKEMEKLEKRGTEARSKLEELKNDLKTQQEGGTSEAVTLSTEQKIEEQKAAVDQIELGKLQISNKRLADAQRDLDLCQRNLAEAEAKGDTRAIAELQENETGLREEAEYWNKSNMEKRELNNIQASHKELNDSKVELKELRDQLANARNNGDERTVNQLEAREAELQKKVDKLEKEATGKQQSFLDRKRLAMEDRDAQREFGKFVDESQLNRNDNTLVDQNGRIIRAVVSMDAEKVFKIVADTGSTVRFADGNDIILHFNKEFRIHPAALEQMCGAQTNERSDLEKVLSLTKAYKSHETPTTEQEREYLEGIGELLKRKYRMMADTEVKHLVTRLTGEGGLLAGLSEEQRRIFEQINPVEAYRLRTVIDDTKVDFQKKVMEAAVQLAERQNVAGNVSEVANCVEIVKIHLNEVGGVNKMEKDKNRDQYLDELLNPNSGKMDALNEHVQNGIQLIRDEAGGHRFGNSDLAAYYHTEKAGHGDEVINAYYKSRGENPPVDPSREDMYKIYHKEMPKEIFNEENLTKRKPISQYGNRTKNYEMDIPREVGDKKTVQRVWMGVTVSRRIPVQENWSYQMENFQNPICATHMLIMNKIPPAPVQNNQL